MVTVAYLGPQGTYTHQAVIQQFGLEVETQSESSIENCFRVIDSGEVDYAVVPFENSTNGQVIFTYDLLRDWYIPNGPTSSGATHLANFSIVAEQFVSIHHNFLTRAEDLSQIKTLYSHPQVWTQVDNFLKSLPLGSVKKIDTLSTSRAAEMVSEDATNTTACISSKMSADLYDVKVLYSNIENVKNNTTRFLVLGNNHKTVPYSQIDDVDKAAPTITSMLFTLNHEDPGALCEVLDAFRSHKVNMTAINSRPSHLKQWQNVFFVETESPAGDSSGIKAAIEEIKSKCLDLSIMGSFKRCWRYRGVEK